MPEIFVNYRTGDGEQAAALLERELSRRFGTNSVFRDSKSIRPGDDYRIALNTASAGARVLLVIIGEKWLDALDRKGNRALDNEEDWTRREIVNALDHGVRVIPILCDKAQPLTPAALPAELSRLADHQFLRFSTRNTEADLNTIAAALADLVPGLVDSTAEKAAPEPGSVYNSNTGTVHGGLVQARDIHGGSVGGIVINNGYTGPQYAGPVFQGPVTGYVGGDNSGGIHQNIGAEQREEQR
ncbi:toll/interleukin-1 receptor domain-containing protein [Amycolatopsis cynarae]|uniref:Toll/interleukin-1 receptor domain-containing protein n=1 Tax=Amycolatopsis cynarae TaxID=2995223 RepID=A0ABY7B8A0_9PSEU|nr:toll/interleukin-1 receptor domain-containing protein [Amycolatopsis sp. HUAS 11-8]WAL68159.1 toll/interleukin-1 receptor domain-containing protein [Amycolatopsis sp. HUAS 11-8]